MTEFGTQPQSSFADFELLAQVSQLLTVTDLDHVLERVIDLTAKAVGASKASLFLHYEHSERWQRLLTPRPLETTEQVRVVESVLDKGLAGWVVRHKQGTVVFDTKTDSRWHVFPDDTKPVRSALCLPLGLDGDVLAVITLEHTEPNHFTEHHLRVLTIVANQAAVAIRNAQLFNRMQEQQRQLEATFHAIPDVLLVVNDGGDVLIANDRARDLLGGLPQEEIVGASLASLVQLDAAFSMLQDLHNNPVPVGQTRTMDVHSERERKDYVVMISRWENTFGSTAGHVIAMHDVTQLRDLDRFKSEMLKMASHDLRSPLALIVGYCDLIRMDTPDEGSPVHEYLDVVIRSTRRMSLLLDDLLRVEEIRTSPSELHKPVLFADLVAPVLENLKMQTNARNQTLEMDIQLEGLPEITVDPLLIREAMENLSSNAVKYTPEGGHIKVTSYYEDWRVHFVVEDNGVGVAEHDLPRIFEWGFRSKRLANHPVDGKGLGLALVKTVMERHRGEVWVESQEGEGSRFGFWLPR